MEDIGEADKSIHEPALEQPPLLPDVHLRDEFEREVDDVTDTERMPPPRFSRRVGLRPRVKRPAEESVGGRDDKRGKKQ